MTTAVPAAVATQNIGLGRSLVRRTPNRAVSIGSRPTMTEPCVALTVRRACALNQPKPTAAPSATTAIPASWLRAGQEARTATRYPAAISAPMTERPTPTTTGSMLATAIRVAGTVPENMTTATTARPSPDTDTVDRRISILELATAHASTIHFAPQVLLCE